MCNCPFKEGDRIRDKSIQKLGTALVTEITERGFLLQLDKRAHNRINGTFSSWSEMEVFCDMPEYDPLKDWEVINS